MRGYIADLTAPRRQDLPAETAAAVQGATATWANGEVPAGMELLDGPEVSVLNQVLASLRFQLAAVASGDDAVADAGLFGSAPPIIVAYGIHVYG